MFGDFGHGIIVTLAATWMVTNEKTLGRKKWGEMWDMFYGGRYIILLMGIFSMYTGLIYNDIFSQAMTLLSSRYVFAHDHDSGKWIGTQSSTYGFGIDPVN